MSTEPKCRKQKTCSFAKSFRFHTYKKQGVGVLWLTTHPVRIRTLSERSESKDLSSHPTKGVCPERPSGARGLPCHSARKPHSMNSFVFKPFCTLFRDGSPVGLFFSVTSALFPLRRRV